MIVNFGEFSNMKEIWKTFCAKCKEAWLKTRTSLKDLYEKLVDDVKDLLVKTLDLVKDLFGNVVKALETLTLSLALGVLTALFEAIYDSIMFAFNSLVELILGKKD